MMIILKGLFSPTSINLHGFHVEGPVIVVIPILLAIALASVASLVWLYWDAEKRDKNGVVGLLFILLTGWPASFIWWFWLRPPLKATS